MHDFVVPGPDFISFNKVATFLYPIGNPVYINFHITGAYKVEVGFTTIFLCAF